MKKTITGYKIKELKKNVQKYVKTLDEVENNIDKSHDYTNYQKIFLLNFNTI